MAATDCADVAGACQHGERGRKSGVVGERGEYGGGDCEVDL